MPFEKSTGVVTLHRPCGKAETCQGCGVLRYLGDDFFRNSRTIMRADGLAALDNRSRDIFRRIVETYLDTGIPVGSRNVSRILSAALSPASVRNVMADLEE